MVRVGVSLGYSWNFGFHSWGSSSGGGDGAGKIAITQLTACYHSLAPHLLGAHVDEDRVPRSLQFGF